MGVPVATPINVGGWAAAAKAACSGADHTSAFAEEAASFLGAEFAYPLNSGRTALFALLRSLRRLSSRVEVVVPAFICPSVARAVLKAGLKPVLCDVGPVGSGLDLGSLSDRISHQTLAVITAHLYGYPVDISGLVALAHASGAVVVEDAAQAFGAKWAGRYVGTIGDAGVFSFAVSKALWAMGGGLITTRNRRLSSSVDQIYGDLPTPGRLQTGLRLPASALVGLLTKSRHLGPINAVWRGFLRGRNDAADFTASRLPQPNAALARALLPQFGEITRIRRQNAEFYQERLAGYKHLKLPDQNAEAEPIFLRFPVIVDNVALKGKLVAALHNKGISASEMYSRPSYHALRQLVGSEHPCPRAEYLFDRMLNLPTHPYLRSYELENAVAALSAVLDERQPFGAHASPSEI